MATPSGAVFLVGGIICSLLPPSPPMAGRLIGGSFCVPALLHFTQCRLRCLGRGGCCAAQLRCLLLLADGGSLALADALPPYSCSLVDALPPVVTSSLADALPLFLYAGGYFAAVVVLFGGCFATVSCFKLALLGIFGDNFLCRSSSSGGFCLGGLCGESSPSVLPLLPACCFSGYGRVCACLYFFFSVSFIFSPLCSCVGQVLFGRNKFVSVTAFFLMKNVLRHGREKKRGRPGCRFEDLKALHLIHPAMRRFEGTALDFLLLDLLISHLSSGASFLLFLKPSHESEIFLDPHILPLYHSTTAELTIPI